MDPSGYRNGAGVPSVSRESGATGQPAAAIVSARETLTEELSMSIAASLFALLALSGSDTPDLIVLQDGKEIECRVLWEDESTIVYTEKRKADEVPTSVTRRIRKA
jgi:hypothetical protein